ncbi:MAG: hypothetical protein PHD05_08910, partial [Sphaerochaetaceae bacterium]|nr:hypothetical protein [Sphaerochaetaceae bacterium]
MNDFRHLFFQVIEGEKEVLNKEELILAYADKIYDIKSEEFIDLFLIRKKLDPKYVGAFIKKISADDRQAFFEQLGEKLRLEQITPEEHIWATKEVVKNGKYNMADDAITMCLENNDLTQEEKVGLADDYTQNIINILTSDDQNNNKA